MNLSPIVLPVDGVPAVGVPIPLNVSDALGVQYVGFQIGEPG